jgi:hypothetical protein
VTGRFAMDADETESERDEEHERRGQRSTAEPGVDAPKTESVKAPPKPRRRKKAEGKEATREPQQVSASRTVSHRADHDKQWGVSTQRGRKRQRGDDSELPGSYQLLYRLYYGK